MTRLLPFLFRRHGVILPVAHVLAACLLGQGLATRDASAGPNANGFLVIHANQSLEFTTDRDYNGSSGLDDCRNAVTEVPGEGQGVVYFALAAFDGYATPDVKALTFGIKLSSPIAQPYKYGPSGFDPFEVTDQFWPGNGSWAGITWTEPLNRPLSEVYWFQGYAYAGQTVTLTRRPGATGDMPDMVDSATPPETDNFEDFGVLGFGVPGHNPCGDDDGDTRGACCGEFGFCILQTTEACALVPGGTHLGRHTTCSPNPCSPIPVEPAPLSVSIAPNPFRGSTSIRFEMPVTGPARLEILDAGGRLVRTLFDETRPFGFNLATWDGADARGRVPSGGVFFLRLTTPAGSLESRVVRAR